MGLFSDPKNTHPGILYWTPGVPPPPWVRHPYFFRYQCINIEQTSHV